MAEPVAKVTASGENPPNETKEKLTDGDANTKWLVRTPTAWVAYELSAPKKITGYALTSANDSAGRDPKDWTLQGSADGQSWTDLDRRTGQTFPERYQTRRFDIAAPQEFTRYRLNVTANSGEPLVQLADLRLFTGSTGQWGWFFRKIRYSLACGFMKTSPIVWKSTTGPRKKLKRPSAKSCKFYRF